MCSGEVSGDRQAAHLARTLLRLNSSIRLYGCGGTQMESAGVDVRIKTAHLGYVGLQESFRFTRPLKNALEQIAGMIEDDRPDMAVLIDSEHFNRSVAKLLSRHHLPFIYYF